MTEILAGEGLVYASLFGIGLVVAVYAMLNGSIRPAHDPSLIKRPPAAFNLPVFGAALTAFGAAGYLAIKYSQFGTIGSFGFAAVAAIAGWVGMTLLMANWAFKGPLNDPHEDLEELQGTVALVTRDISPEEPGEILYSFRGQELTAEARCISQVPVPAGTEVIIEIVKDGLAEVELWSVVEERINGHS